MSQAGGHLAWLRCYHHVPEPIARLVCLPHAGGAASFFRAWHTELPRGVQLLAVQYPGREDRLREPLEHDLRVMAERIATALRFAGPPLPLVLFGHSLGAAVGYEVAVRLRETGAEPVALAVSGRQAPRNPGRMVHLMDDATLWAEIRKGGGTSEQILDNAEMRELLLPVLRADYWLSETYLPVPAAPLACPVLACNGDQDDEVEPAAMPEWAEVTTGPFESRVFPGGHFYLVDCRRELLTALHKPLLFPTMATARWPMMP